MQFTVTAEYQQKGRNWIRILTTIGSHSRTKVSKENQERKIESPRSQIDENNRNRVIEMKNGP